MKQLFQLLVLSVITITTHAQSKVFKEISDDVSSEMKVITQDEALVGYLMFTRLEKASEDSFNYRISLLDENLNDIGSVNFREESLNLEAVSLEEDVLCLAYIKSNAIGREFKNKKEFNEFEVNNSLFTQFLTLEGKIIRSSAVKINLKSTGYDWLSAKSKYTYAGNLTHTIQLKNIPKKGFACFYGDADNCSIVSYDLSGKQIWKKEISQKQAYSLLTTKDDIYLLEKQLEKEPEGGFGLLSYAVADGTSYNKIILNDKQGNSLKVIGFGNDPVTGRPFISGNIINQKGGLPLSGLNIARGPYSGVFAMDINGHDKKDLKQAFTYWNDGSKMPAISKRGKITDTKSYILMSNSYRDYNGNTYFMGAGLVRRPKIGALVFGIGLSWLIVPPLYIALASGYSKVKIMDAVLMKMNNKGVLSYDNTIEWQHSKFIRANFPISRISDNRRLYSVENADTKSNFIIADDSKDILIYNVNQRKVVRTISHKDGKSRINVFPAKEGHIMVVENNKKEKYTRLSIEGLN